MQSSQVTFVYTNHNRSYLRALFIRCKSRLNFFDIISKNQMFVLVSILLHQMLLAASLAQPRISLQMDPDKFNGLMFIPVKLALKTRLKRTSGKTWIDRNRRISLSLSPSLCLCPPSLGFF